MQQDPNDYVAPDGWERVTPEAFRDAPFRMYVNHFKSGSPRLRAFIENPRAFMRGTEVTLFNDGVEIKVAGEEIEGVSDDARISTWIVNHHRTLQRMILYATATVDDAENAVHVTTWKQDS